MTLRARSVTIVAFFAMLFAFARVSYADEPQHGSGHDEHAGSAHDEHAGSDHDTHAEHAQGSDHQAEPASGESDHHEAGSAEHHDEQAGSAEHHDEHGGSAEHHDAAAAGEHPGEAHHGDADHSPTVGADTDGDGIPEDEEPTASDVDGDGIPDAEEAFDEDDPPTDPFDEDGDGVVEPNELEDKKAFVEEFKGIPHEPDEHAIVERGKNALDALKGSLTIEKFRGLVKMAKKIVLEKMEKKIEKKSEKKMRTFSLIVVGVSFCGVFLLLMPLFLRKKYPGQGALLFKYSALAALVFFVTVNLFGGVLYGYRLVQGAMSNYTNPSIAIAAGTFDTLDKHAEDYVTTGKELFGPTLEEMRKHPDEQPVALIIENGQKIVKDAKVFLSIKKMIKKVDWIFSALPVVLLLVTLILFIVAILPTLKEIIRLPALAAEGNLRAGRDVTAKAMRRVKGEVLATVCTIGVLIVLTMISGFVLGRMVMPSIDALLRYFSLSVNYLMFTDSPSSGLVFMTLFGVVLFLVFNLGALILSMAFFLGKTQKIFQQRFNEGTPISTHQRFFKWGVPSVLLVQIFPLLFALLADPLLKWIKDSAFEGALNPDAVSWGKVLLAGPIILVVAFIVTFWAARGIKAIQFLQSYKVKGKPSPHVSSSQGSAMPMPPAM